MSDLLGIGSIASSIGNYFSTQKTNQTNVKLQREAQQYATDMWNKQNEYNTPEANMKRLEAAGLNPNLAYGQVAESRAANPTTVSPAHLEAPKIDGSALSAYQQVKNMQTLNARQNIDLETARANAIKSASDAEFSVYENEKLKGRGATKYDSVYSKTAKDAVDTLGDYLGGVVKRTNEAAKAAVTAPWRLLKYSGAMEGAHTTVPAPIPELGDSFDGGQ